MVEIEKNNILSLVKDVFSKEKGFEYKYLLEKVISFVREIQTYHYLLIHEDIAIYCSDTYISENNSDQIIFSTKFLSK